MKKNYTLFNKIGVQTADNFTVIDVNTYNSLFCLVRHGFKTLSH